MEPYPSRVVLALRVPANQRPASGIGVLIAWRFADSEGSCFHQRGVTVIGIRRDSEPGIGPYPPQVSFALRAPANL